MATPPPVQRPTGAVTNGHADGMFSVAGMQERRRVRRPTASPPPSPRFPAPPVRGMSPFSAGDRQVIQIHRSDVLGNEPTGLKPGELAIEYASQPVKMWVGVEAAIDAAEQKELQFGALGFPAIITEPFDIPAIGATVVVEVDDARMIVPGLVVFIAGATFAVTAVSGLDVTLLRLNEARDIISDVTGAGLFGRSEGLWVAIPSDAIGDAPTGALYGRTEGAWQQIPPAGIGDAPNDQLYGRTEGSWLPTLPRSGGTLTGNLTIAPASGTSDLILDKFAANVQARIHGNALGVARWRMSLGDNTAEAAPQTGSDFVINRYNNTGGLIDATMRIRRSDGTAFFKDVWGDTVTGDMGLGSGILGMQQVPDIVGPYITMTSGGRQRRIRAIPAGNFEIMDFLPTSTARITLRGSDNHVVLHGSVSIAPNGNIGTDGTLAAANFPSEARFKTDLTQYERGLDAICALRPMSWKWNGLGGVSDPHDRVQYGVIADEAQPALPEAIGERQMEIEPGGREPVKTLDDKPIIYALVNAVRELSERLKQVENAHGHRRSGTRASSPRRSSAA